MTHETLLIFIGSVALLLLIAAWRMWVSATKAKARVSQLEVEMAAMAYYPQAMERLKAELSAEQLLRIEAEKNIALMQQRVVDMDARAKDVEEFKKAAKASVMEAGQQLSSKLLEDHKREALAAKEAQEKVAKQTAEHLLNTVQNISKEVATIQSRNADTGKQMETVMRALTHPAGAGALAEIGLENSLKSLGLEPERDFIMQFHVGQEDGSNLRPDAVIFLSNDMVLVIDSKASKHMIELTEAEGSDSEGAVLKQLLASMHKHLDALSRKSYADAVGKLLKERGRTLGHIMNVMYLPSEALIERLRKADKMIAEKCQSTGIILAGPASLAALFSLSRQTISHVRQNENQQRIISEVSELMGAVITVLAHVDGVGKNLKNAAQKFDEFAKSVNKRMLPKLRTLNKLGVEAPKNKPLPMAVPLVLESYEPIIDLHDESDVLALEAKAG